MEGYSLGFRHDEFRSALQAILREEQLPAAPMISFANALALNTSRTSTGIMATIKEDAYNQAMQYICTNHTELSLEHFARAARRCSLVHALYQIVATTNISDHNNNTTATYEELCDVAMAGADFSDLQDPSLQVSWCVRVRHYDAMGPVDADLPRYGHRTRSCQRERAALRALTPLLLTFTGPVRLEQPDCKIYIFDGVIGRQDATHTTSVLTKRIARGVRTAILNPNTRVCVTNTPLCPIAACLMCNIGQLRKHAAVLDPYVGSGSILLAAALLEPTSRTVGIEIAHDGLVNRDKIREDFRIRDHLTPPKALLHGDCTNPLVRRQALEAIGDEPFDCILTDPPYGIRESLVEQRPIHELLEMIRHDREKGRPLLRKGGRLVVFLPQPEEMALTEMLPSQDNIKSAGLQLELCTEQYLSDVLSRWLVSFVCLT